VSTAPHDGYGNWAQQYRDRLWLGVIPLPHNRKSPVPDGYTGRKGTYPDDQQIATWVMERPHGNIALRMPGDVLGIDVDDYVYRFQARDPKTRKPLTEPDGSPKMVTGVKTGGATLAALEEQLGPLPPTWRSSSRGSGPSGIRFYRVPSGLLWGDLGEHLEGIWWGHRYAVVYPSINPDSGRQYLWIDETSQRPEWGVLPPKVTDLPSLPEPWVARYGRDKDAPRPGISQPRKRQRTGAGDADRGAAHSSTFSGSGGGPRRFTRQQALDYVQPHLDQLRSATVGSINIQLNNAAKVMSHFVPSFWTDAQARLMLWDALSATAYDGRSWTADPTITSAFESATGDWAAELEPEPLGWVAPTEAQFRVSEAQPRPAPPPRDGHDEGSPWPVEPPADPDPHPNTPGAFWRRREVLEQVWTYARSRYTAPWAVLGAVLARAVAAVEPNIKLPAIIGSPASLNLFVALVGPSGGGKDAAAGVAEHALLMHDHGTAIHTETVPLGSGEGLSHIYMRPPAKLARRKRDDDEDSTAIGLGAPDPDQPTQYRTRALVTVAEIDTLTALAARQSATVSGQLRQAAMGDQLGFFYVDTAKRMLVPKHSYRLCLIAGVQPGRAQGLLGETEGGTPQRFLWLPATDPTMTREAPERPDPIAWTPPRYNGPEGLITVCQQACDVVLDAHIARQRGQGDALDGHALLTRLKVAAALAMLDLGRSAQQQCQITEDDWDLSGQVMTMSDQTRQMVESHLKDTARAENEKRAMAKARETVVITEVVEQEAMGKVLSWLRRKISTEWITERELRNASKSNTREHIPDGIDRLIAVGEIEAELYEAGHQTARRLRRVGPTPGGHA